MKVVKFSMRSRGKNLFSFLIFKKPVYIGPRRFRGSSMVEHATVNRRVAGSSPARGAGKRAAHFLIKVCCLFWFIAQVCHFREGGLVCKQFWLAFGKGSQNKVCGLQLKICILDGSFSLIQTPSAMNLLVPAYFYPGENWDKLTAAASRVGIVAIANPNSGPGAASDAMYTNAITNFRNAGGQVIGYVSTRYANRCAEEVKAEIDLWISLYPNIDGIFFDEMSNYKTESHINYYLDLTSYVKTTYAGRHFTVANPGTSFPEIYLTSNCVDCFVIFESCTGFDSWSSDSWVKTLRANRFAVLPYNICSSRIMNTCVDRASNEGVGFVYVTDDGGCNPWDALPSYWDALVSKVASK